MVQRDGERGPAQFPEAGDRLAGCRCAFNVRLPHLQTPLTVQTTHIPHSKYTTHLLSTDEFALLHASNPRGTYIANIARGAIIDQAALITALKTNQIRGAALDVTDPEPLPKDDPLWDAPNVLITPHVGGASSAMFPRMVRLVQQQIGLMLEGKEPVNVVLGGAAE